jgi:hypothetical protein
MPRSSTQKLGPFWRHRHDAQPFHRADVLRQASLALSYRSCQTFDGTVVMGPSRSPAEPESAYRWRYALYCIRWFACLAFGLGLLMALRPSVHDCPLPFLVVFLYVGLPLGTATSGLAALGFLAGAFWSGRLERSPGLATTWPKAKAWLRTLVLLPICGFGAIAIARGVIDGEIWILRRYGPLSTVSLTQEPWLYSVMMVAWCAVTAGLAYYQLTDLRRAHAISTLLVRKE